MKVLCEINENTLLDLVNISTGLFYPLRGFMNSTDYYSVVNNMTLVDGSVWTIPITLDVNLDAFVGAKSSGRLYLAHRGITVGFIEVEDCFVVDIQQDSAKIYGTCDENHPGVGQELKRFAYRVGGPITVIENSILQGALHPTETRTFFEVSGWKTIAGFQTRNPPHKAHEHLHRTGLDVCDGLFINPLIGWKKNGDFTDQAVMDGYKAMIDNYYPNDRVYLAGLSTAMRYAGPREAVFHAIIRRNLGCTHFFIGRDHAGVGEYYGKYEAQDLARNIAAKHKLGIELLLIQDPHYCKRCGQIATSKHCNHQEKDKIYISGSKIRDMLVQGKEPDPVMMREEVAQAILKLGDKMFIEK